MLELIFLKVNLYLELSSGPWAVGIEFDNKGNVISIEKKPEYPKSNYAV